MATNTVESSHPQKDQVDYKQKYKTLKRKLRMLVYEQECFLEELRKAQRKLLKISRDRSFLLDRLLVYEKIDESSSDSEATATSESDGEMQKEGTASKKKKGQQSNQPDPWFLGTMSNPALMSLQNLAQGMKAEPSKKKAKTTVKKSNKSPKLPASTKISLLPQQLQTVKGEPNMLPTVVKMEPGTIPTEGHMTREELERHLDSRQSSRPQYMSFVKASHVLPDDIFSHENSNPDGDLIERGIEVDDQDLIIDMPQ